MAFDAFLKLGDGSKVKGESTDSKHTNEIAVFGIGWGVSNPSSIGSTTTGSGSGKASFGNLVITKKVDQGTATLMQMCASGDHFDTAQLTVRKAGGKNPLEYAIYTFKQVYVDGVTHAGVAGSSDELMETLNLSYGEVHLKYTPQKPDGTGGSPVEGGWDLTTNTAS